jgi:HKD family nuclease
MATTTKAKVKVIEREYFNGTQSVEFKGIYEYKGHKLKIHIDIDSYDFQSSGKISIFHPEELKWNMLQFIPYSRMESVKNVFYQRKVDDLRFSEKLAIQKDIDELLRRAKQIL